MNQDPKKLLASFQPKEVKVLKPDQQMCAIRFSPCGKLLTGACFDGTVRRWDASTDQMPELAPLKGHGGWVTSVAFHPDKKRLFSVDSWGQLLAWPYAEKEAKSLWSVPQAHDGWVRQLALSADGKLLATCGIDKKVRVWSTDGGTKVNELSGHADDVFAVAFHLDGKSLVSGDLKGVVRQWDLASGKAVRDLDARVLYFFERLQDVGGVRRLVFDAVGTTLAAAGCEPKSGGFVQGAPAIVLFDWQTGKVKQTLRFGTPNDGYVHDLHFHPAGFLMSVTSGQPGNGKLFFQQPADAQPFFTSTGLVNCHALAVHPNGTRLAVSATNGSSGGNGRQLGPNKEYPGNWSPLHILDMPKPA